MYHKVPVMELAA